MGGSGSIGGNALGNVQDIMSLVGIKAAKDLSLDLSQVNNKK